LQIQGKNSFAKKPKILTRYKLENSFIHDLSRKVYQTFSQFYLHGKNNFTEGSKILLDINRKSNFVKL